MEIRILVAGEQIGPYSETEVRHYLGQGLVSPSDLAVREGMQEWQPLDHILGPQSTPDSPAEIVTPDIAPEMGVTAPDPIHVDMYPVAVPEVLAPAVPPHETQLLTKTETAPPETPTLPPPLPDGIVTESILAPVAATATVTAPDAPADPLPSRPISIMPTEQKLEEAPTPTTAELARALTATQKAKRNKIVIQPILPLEASAPTSAPVLTPVPPPAQKKTVKTGRTALTMEPLRPTTALPPVAGFAPKETKEKKPVGRNVVRTGAVSMGDLFDKPAATSAPASAAIVAPAAKPVPKQPPKLSMVSSAPALASAPATVSTPPLDAPKPSGPPTLPTMRSVLSKPDFPSSNKPWVQGIPNSIIYAGVAAAIFFACLVAFVIYLLMSGHDNGPAPNATNASNAPPAPAPAIEVTAPVVAAEPKTAADFSARGAERQKNSDIDGALQDYDQALSLDPTDLKTRYQRGLLRETKSDWQGALSDYNAILAADPKNADAYSNRGFIKQTQGDVDGALADYAQALSLNPKISQAYYNVGLIKVQKGDLDGAIAAYNQALLLDPKMAIAYYNRGNAKNTEGNLDGAIADYTQALTLEPNIALAYCNRGFARQTKGDLDGALDDYTKAVAINPKMAVAFYNRGLIKIQKNDLAGAIEDSSVAIDLDPKNAQAYCNRGLALMGRNDLQRGMADLRKFCDLAPRDTGADAARLYMWVMAMKQNPKGAADPDLSTALLNEWNSPPEDLTSKIAAFLLGHIREKELIANAASPDQTREPGQYCKAWYFAGIKRLLAGDKTVAATDFQKCVATNQNTFCEYIFAKAELQTLTAARDSAAQTAATP
jgi:tetratricopeptide (TPR) repeat protein